MTSRASDGAGWAVEPAGDEGAGQGAVVGGGVLEEATGGTGLCAWTGAGVAVAGAVVAAATVGGGVTLAVGLAAPQAVSRIAATEVAANRIRQLALSILASLNGGWIEGLPSR